MNGDEWLTSLSRASVARLAETDKDLQDKARTLATTVSFVIIGGYVVTMVSVGDSRCIIEIIIYSLSEDHRLKCNEEERDRITARSGEVGRLNIVGGAHVLVFSEKFKRILVRSLFADFVGLTCSSLIQYFSYYIMDALV